MWPWGLVAACGIFPDQGSNLCPLHWQWILTHWATREDLDPFLKTMVQTLYSDDSIKKLKKKKKIKPKQVCLVKLNHKQVEM